MPHKGEVLDATVKSVNKMGFFAEAGPLQLFVSNHLIPEEFEFDTSHEPAYVTSEGDKIIPGSEVRVRIVGTRVDANEIFARLPRQLLVGLLLGFLWCRHVRAYEGEDYNLDYLEEFSSEELQAPSRMGDTRLSAVVPNIDRKVKNGVNTRLHLLERWTGSIRLNYRFKFSSNFKWGSGGILPGILGGRWWCTPNHRSSQCWRIQLGWNERGEADIVSRVPQAKSDISKISTLKFQKSAWNRVSIVVRVNTGRSSNGEVEISVNDKVLALESGILFSADKTRSVY
eukprot:jgi/Picre1/35410/NNA_002872.t1